MEDSPPPFIVFRAANVEIVAPAAALYQLSLQLVGAVHQLVDGSKPTEGGHAMKKRLDTSATQIVMGLARLQTFKHEKPWQAYRSAHMLLVDMGAILDILAAQGGSADALGPAQTLVRVMTDRLGPLALV